MSDHPELMLGPNPFLEGVSPFIPFKELPSKLRCFPLDDVDWRTVAANQREPFLDLSDRHFAPTAAVIEPAAGIQTLLRKTLVFANPLSPSNRKLSNQIAMAESVGALAKIAPAQGGGMLLSGMTATGKSTLLKRALQTFAPLQVVDHGNSEVCGFYGLRQCVYLIIDHPSNGTRGGLLKRILQSLDSAVQTNYYEEHQKVSNLDSLLVTVSKLLTRHRVAILCIDEKQEVNYENSPWQIEFALFYLHLMNLGISVVLSGNPLAFGHLELYSQLMRRFSEGGIHTLHPAPPIKDTWWDWDFVPQARMFCVVEKWNVNEEFRRRIELESSGGLPGLFTAYHKEVQRSALRRGGIYAEVIDQDYLAAQRSPRFNRLGQIAIATTSEEARVASRFIDIPPMTMTTKRASRPVLDLPVEATNLSAMKGSISAAEKLVRSFKAQQTREANKLSKSLKALSTLPPEDVRRLGTNEELVSSMLQHLATLEAGSTRKSRRTKGG